MRTSAQVSTFQRAVVVGAALAGVLWGFTGVVALLDPGPDPGPAGSSSFYLIEGSHALAETGMFVALIGLWRSHTQRIGRLGNLLFGLAVTATVLLAVLTYLVVGASALRLGPRDTAGQTVPAPLVALASALFLFTVVGVLGGYIGSGVTTIRAGVWPPLIGWPLIAHPFLLVAKSHHLPCRDCDRRVVARACLGGPEDAACRKHPIFCAGSGRRGPGVAARAMKRSDQ